MFVSVGRRDFEITSFIAAVIQYGDMDELFDDQILVNSCTFNCKNCVLWKLSGVCSDSILVLYTPYHKNWRSNCWTKYEEQLHAKRNGRSFGSSTEFLLVHHFSSFTSFSRSELLMFDIPLRPLQ